MQLSRPHSTHSPIALPEGLFLAGFAITALTTLFVRTNFTAFFVVPRDIFELGGYILGAVLLLAKVLMDREASWRYAATWGLVTVCIASLWVAQAWRFSALFLFIAAGKGVSLRRLAVIVLAVHVAVFAVTVPCALLGRVDSVAVWRMVDGHWVPRLSYGYSHPNMLGQSLLAMASAFMVLRFPRFHGADALAYVVLAATAALLVGARTATICIVLVAAGALLAPRIVGHRRRRRVLAVGALATFVAACAVSLLMMIFYNPDSSWMHAVDDALSTRFSLAHRFYEVFGVAPFGRDLMAVKVDDFLQLAPDNAYARAVVKHGVVPALVLGALVTATLLKAVREARFDACVLGLAVYAVGACMEMYAVNFTLNFFLLGCAWMLFDTWPEPASASHEPRGRGAHARNREESS